MFDKSSNKTLVAMVAPLGLAIGLSATSMSAVSADKYVISGGSGEVVVNNFAECWESIGGINTNCGQAVIKPTPEPSDGDSDGDGVADKRDRCPSTPKGVVVTPFGCPKDTDRDGVADYKDKCPNSAKGARVDATGCEVIKNLIINTTTDYFDFDSARLKPDMKTALDAVAAKVNASAGNESLIIIGHTDSIGSNEYNQALSERRARSAAKYLARKGLNNLSTKGMGESQPAADNRTRKGRAMNRRVEVRTQ